MISFTVKPTPMRKPRRKPNPQRFLVIIAPDGMVTRKPFKGTPKYEALRAAVGGLIQPVKVRYEGKKRQGYVNEEGLLLLLQPNDVATRLFRDANPGYSDILVGNLVIVC